MADNEQNQILGSGKLYFDPFVQNSTTKTGLLYFGNTPEFGVSNATTALDHFDSDNGLKQKDKSVTLSAESTGTFTCDNISMENLALFFLGEVVAQTNAALANQSDTFLARRGRFYQLGVSQAQPQGAVFVTAVTAAIVDPAGPLGAENFTVDLETGLFGIRKDAPAVPEGGVRVTVTYSVTAGTQSVVIAKGTEAYGELKFLSKNPEGRQRDYLGPKVKITPDGDLALKGDDWQTVGFSVEFLKRDSLTERLYIRDRG